MQGTPKHYMFVDLTLLILSNVGKKTSKLNDSKFQSLSMSPFFGEFSEFFETFEFQYLYKNKNQLQLVDIIRQDTIKKRMDYFDLVFFLLLLLSAF